MTATDTAPTDVERTAEDQVAQAEREATEAAALVDALEDRVRDGDDTVTPEQIEHARALGRFAQLRAEATRRKADQAKAAAHAQALAQLRAEIRAEMTGGAAGMAAVDDALTAVTDACATFIRVTAAHNNWHDTMRARIRDLAGVNPNSNRGGDREAQLAFADPGHSGLDPAYVAVDEDTIEAAPAGDLLAAALYQVAVADPSRSPYTGGLPMQGGYASIERLLAGTLTRPDEWFAAARQRLTDQAAAARARTQPAPRARKQTTS